MNKIGKILISFGVGIGLMPWAQASGTVVGNGGDPVFEFMEAARSSMIETLKALVNDPKEMASFCQLPQLNAPQITYCHDFFNVIALDILRLSQGLRQTAFVLRADPLLVTGIDGKPMIVAARTQLGPDGPIELHRDSVKTLMPTQILFLLTHEFQHKANFNGNFVTDNEVIGPFATGRDLIDAVASSVVSVARKKGKVGTQFGIRDIFDCRVMNGTAQFGARISSSRLFQSDDLMSYETSVGKNPSDASIFLPESIDTSLQFKFSISEPNNCGDANPLRKTKVQMARVKKADDGSSTETLLVSQDLPQNPMCATSPFDLEISWQQVKFSCRYYGSEGTTSSVYALRSIYK